MNHEKIKYFPRAAAFVLSVAGVFTTKAAKINHVVTIATISDGSCVIHIRLKGVTKSKIAGHTLIVNTKTAFTKIDCRQTLYTIAN